MNGGLYAVAGASGAIGRQLCKNIQQWGGTPLLIGRSEDKLRQVNEEWLGGIDACPIIAGCDFSNATALEETSQRLTAEFKKYATSKNNNDTDNDTHASLQLRGIAYAVGSITLKSIRGAKVQDFQDSYNVNVLGAVEFIKAALPSLKKAASTGNGQQQQQQQQPSSIVLFSSIAASHGLKNHAVIGSTKAAVEGLTVSLAAELSPTIRVNCVAPSLTGGGSEMAKSMTDNESIAQAVAAAHPIPRLGHPIDSANAASFLLSNHSSWTTGTVLPVDGGRSTILK